MSLPAALGLEARDLSALTLVAAYDGCQLDWLRQRIDLTQSGTVRLVDRLAGRGLVIRGAPRPAVACRCI